MSQRASKILIVDDDLDFSESTAVFLRSNGFEVEQAYSGYDGLRRARLDAPDLVLMDVMMEERTEGFFVVQQLRREEELGDLPIVVISSLYDDQPGFRAAPDPRWLAHDAFLSKPLDLDALLGTIAELLARSGDAAPAHAAEALGRQEEP
jgi:CheY-like chemotaxis protein